MTQHGGEAGGETKEGRHDDSEEEDEEVLASGGNGGGNGGGGNIRSGDVMVEHLVLRDDIVDRTSQVITPHISP